MPHATAAYLAREILRRECGGRIPAVITTLHGTDITLVGSDPSYAETVRFSIDRSDAVTAVSESLRADTVERLKAVSPIRVIPNFLDCDRVSNTGRQSAAASGSDTPAGSRNLLSSATIPGATAKGQRLCGAL